MVVTLLSKAASRILAELCVLSKGINLELISSLKYIFFVGSSTHKCFLTTKNFQTMVDERIATINKQSCLHISTTSKRLTAKRGPFTCVVLRCT